MLFPPVVFLCLAFIVYNLNHEMPVLHHLVSHFLFSYIALDRRNILVFIVAYRIWYYLKISVIGKLTIATAGFH